MKPGGRQRGVSIHVFLTPTEAAQMRALAKHRELTLAQLLRHWIARANGQRRTKGKRTPKANPRQLDAFAAAANSIDAQNARALENLGTVMDAAREAGFFK